MIYLLITNIATLLILLAFGVTAAFEGMRNRDHFAKVLEQRDAREDMLLQRIQAPTAAVAQQTVREAAQYGQDYPPLSIATDDDAAAAYELERERLERETKAMIEAVELQAVPQAHPAEDPA